jgi:hypothetical protein
MARITLNTLKVMLHFRLTAIIKYKSLLLADLDKAHTAEEKLTINEMDSALNVVQMMKQELSAIEEQLKEDISEANAYVVRKAKEKS